MQDLARSATEDALRQLVQQGFDYGRLVRIVLDLTRVTGHRPCIGEVLDNLLRLHPVGDLARAWDSGGVLLHARASDDSQESIHSQPPSLQRSSSAPASAHDMTQPPDLLRASSLPAPASVANGLGLHSHYAGASLETVARLLLRAADAAGSGRLSSEDRLLLKEQLRRGELDDMHEQLQGLQLSTDGLQVDGNASLKAPADRHPFECPICFDEVAEDDVVQLPCEDRHRFCRDCLMHHVEAVTFPRCPHFQCRYEFTEEDVMCTFGDGRRLGEFREMMLQRAVMRLHGRVACPNPECHNVVVCDPERRSRLVCECNWPAFCSICRQPYHYNSACGMVQPLRSRWLDWMRKGRAEYHGVVSSLDEITEKHQRAVEVAIDRHRELEADEDWKAQHCRLCPKCFRTIQKTEGCNSMVCGRNYHGGNDQQGCGHSFAWDSAPKYQPRMERIFELPTLDFSSEAKVQSAYVRHMFTTCNLCQKSLRGPRFHCIHCEAFDCCIDCEKQLAQSHSQDHVFDILFEPSDPINCDLLVGTTVEVFGLDGSASALNGIAARVARFLPDVLSYELDLPFAGGQGIVPAKNIQPANVTDAAEAQEVLEQSLAQQEARRFHLKFNNGQLVQLMNPSGRPDLCNALGTVKQYRPSALPKYLVELKAPPGWSCMTCTLNNAAGSVQCTACGAYRSQDQGHSVWVCAEQTAPLISDVSDVKDLALLTFSEQGRLCSAAVANQRALDTLGEKPLNLPAHQQVLCLDSSAQMHVDDEKLGVVVSYHPWSSSYKVRLEAPAQGEVKLLTSLVRAVFWREEDPGFKADICIKRHEEEMARLAKVREAHEKLNDVFWNLPPSQHVVVTFSRDREARECLIAALSSTMAETPSGQMEVLPAIVVEFSEIEGTYKLAEVPDIGLRLRAKTVPAECVRPVLWNNAQPVAHADSLVAAHEKEHKRRSEVIEANALSLVQTAKRGLPQGTLVENDDLDGKRWRVRQFIRTDCTYIVTDINASGKHQVFPASKIRPVFWDSDNPFSAASAVIRADHEEKLRLEACVAAEKLAEGSFLALPEQALIRHYNMVCSIVSYDAEHREYKVVNKNVFGQQSFCSRCSASIDWRGDRVQTSSAVACCCGSTMTQRAVPCQQVQPIFLNDDDPLASASKVCESHIAELKRLEELEPVHKATEHGGLLALEKGQLVGLIGEGVWRRPSEDHNGQAEIISYDPERQTYDICFGLWKSLHACGGGSIITVSARYLKPLFWRVSQPSEVVKQILEQHGIEKRRLQRAKEANASCSDVCLALPEGTDVILKPSSSYFKEWRQHKTPLVVESWCQYRQHYAIKAKSGFHSCAMPGVPASDVQPCFWRVSDPSCKSEELVRAHDAETLRLERVRACERDLGAGILDLPEGFPVRLLQSVSLDKPLQPPKSTTWRSWLHQAMPFYLPEGCGESDIAVVVGYNVDGTYCLAVQAGDPTWRLAANTDEGATAGTVTSGRPWHMIAALAKHCVNSVPAAAVAPVCLAATDPLGLTDRLRQRHAAAQARLSVWKQAAQGIKTTYLALPPGTAVVVDGLGQGTIRSYDAHGPGYIVHTRFCSVLSYATAEKVKPTCLECPDPAAAVIAFQDAHKAELRRLEVVIQANTLVRDLHENLPIGTEVQINRQIAMQGEGEGALARIVQQLPGNPPQYSLRLHLPTAASISSDSYVDVLASQISPVFWASAEPLEEAQELLQRCKRN